MQNEMKYLSFSAERIFFFFFQLLTKYLYTIHTLYCYNKVLFAKCNGYYKNIKKNKKPTKNLTLPNAIKKIFPTTIIL